MKASVSINVAYNDYNAFEIVNNSMVKYSVDLIGEYSSIPYNFEILEIFFKDRNINWINCNFTWGWYDYETGRWTGAVGKVEMNTFLLK